MKPLDDPLTILVIDDEKGIRDGAQRILSKMGFSVITARQGEEGLSVLAEKAVAIILLDLKMPGIDGMEVLARVNKQYPHVLVIVITGFATIETAIEAMKQGAYDFIPKPFEPDQLRIVVNRAKEKIRLETEAQRLEAEKQRTLADLGAEQSRIRTIIDSLPNGVLVTNADGMVVFINPALKLQLDLAPDSSPGLGIEQYISDKGLCKLILDISRGKHVDFEDIPQYEFSIGDQKYLLARARPVLGQRNQCLGAVVNVVDITAMKVLDRLKSEFVAKVSHELRSPLSTIHEQLALVLNDIIDQVSSTDRHLLSRAKEKTKGLISLIGDLLDLSRIEAGAVCQEIKPVQLEELLEKIIDFLSAQAKAKNQTLTLQKADQNLPPVKADPLTLESIFGNLITNAINYTGEGGRITVAIDLSGIHIRVQVIDNGFGIEERHLEKIFERFYRVKNEKTRYITGTGLGLPIVKGLVDSLGGFISVQSTPGQGSTFTVLLPANKQP